MTIVSRPSSAAISTHALTEGDAEAKCRQRCDNSFQLTPSRRATDQRIDHAQDRQISTHALTEGDVCTNTVLRVSHDFNSRPHGGRRVLLCHCLRQAISTHALTEGDPPGRNPARCRTWISTHALTEGDGKFRQIFSSKSRLCLFNISIFSSSFHLSPPPNSIFSAKIL